MHYLYKKTHNKTGLKYLGTTIAANPYKYKGSGKYWRLHIKKHGYDVTTEILGIFKNKKDVIKLGLHYSKLWNVVESTEWANLTAESGNGGQTLFNLEANRKNARLGGLARGKHSAWNKGIKTGPESIETKSKKSTSHKGMKRSYRSDGSWFWIKKSQHTELLSL